MEHLVSVLIFFPLLQPCWLLRCNRASGHMESSLARSSCSLRYGFGQTLTHSLGMCSLSRHMRSFPQWVLPILLGLMAFRLHLFY